MLGFLRRIWYHLRKCTEVLLFHTIISIAIVLVGIHQLKLLSSACLCSRMQNNSAHDDAAVMRQMLLDQAYLDDQFLLLEQLERDDNPNFVQNIFGLYFEDTERYVRTVERCLEMVLPDDEDLDRALYHLKGSSACIGANKVKIEVNRLRGLCKEKDAEIERCKEVLKNLKRERSELKDKMDNYFQLLWSAEPEPSSDSVVTEE